MPSGKWPKGSAFISWGIKLPQFETVLQGFIHTHSMPLIEHWWG